MQALNLIGCRAGRKAILQTRGLYILATGFFVDGKNKFGRRKGRMKTLWIGMMAITFVLGTGMVAVMYILGKMVFSYAKSIA